MWLMGIICRSIAWCFTGLNQARSTHDLGGAFNAPRLLSGAHPYRKLRSKREDKNILAGWQGSSGACGPLNGCRR